MDAKIISVAHRKGGLGKTSITLHLATALAKKKKLKVMVLDTDSQQSAFKYREFEQQSVYGGAAPPYPIERVQPKFLFDEIRHLRSKYDVIFIDVPRLTEGSEDSQLSTAITYCDYLLIPIVAGDLEGLSTIEFIKLVKGIDEYKSEKGFSFTYWGFLNKRNQRSENDEAVAFMKKLGVPMFENSLSDVKALSKPFTYESVLDNAEGERRFGPFFKEFLKKFKF
ncbi:MAG: AAA family ATPase [Bacteroidetes bacterium]|nr:AAA family ATPase [Bacteroidota bacterium]